MQLWGAADLILLAGVYALFAWGRYQERWAHIAAWLGFGSGGLIAIVYSQRTWFVVRNWRGRRFVVYSGRARIELPKNKGGYKEKSARAGTVDMGSISTSPAGNGLDCFGWDNWDVPHLQPGLARRRADSTDLGGGGADHYRRLVRALGADVSAKRCAFCVVCRIPLLHPLDDLS